jgi:alanine transaminase
LFTQQQLELQCNPPKEGDPSYALFNKESSAIMEALATKASLITKAFNSMTNWSCVEVQGALFAFPRVTLTQKVIEAARQKGEFKDVGWYSYCEGMEPDSFYANELLEATGVCCSSGNIFGQKEGTYHVRLTLMPSVDRVKLALDRWATFNEQFFKKYSDSC